MGAAAARTKLKKLLKEAEEKARKDAADASSKGPTERSPHAKEVRRIVGRAKTLTTGSG